MRGLFAIVLVAGVGAAAFVLLSRGGDSTTAPPDASAGSTVAQDPAGDDAAVRLAPDTGDAAEASAELARAARAGVLGAREQLAAGDGAAAARTLLGIPAGMQHTDVRRAALDLADRLEKNAARSADEQGTHLRLSARALAARVYDCEAATADEHDRAFETCRRLHDTLVFGNAAPDELVLRHRIGTGELVWKLAHGPWRDAGITVAPGFVLHVNGISDATRVRAGKTLRVPRDELTLLIRKSRFELTVLLGGAPIERFAVGIGAAGSTPAGRMSVLTMQKNPDWYFDGRRIPYGHPDNVIGTRWIGFEGDARAEGIGIHGTNDETTVGKAVSMGCIRMRRGEVERLFEWVNRGTRVEVRD